tara:strand:- start:293 stop:2392 length:2100 start_codon:yes stop_codon:yes gene_type:complete
MSNNTITVKFKPEGDKALKAAIESLAAAQKRYEEGVHLVEQRVSSNTKTHRSHSKILDSLKGKFAVLRNSLLLYAFGYGILKKSIGGVISSYAEQQLAERKLEQALGRTSSALLSHASALQGVTTFGDETIISAQALLAAFVDDEQQLKRATIATLDLAAAKGMDLASAADLVGKTLGSSTNSLSRYGIEVEGAVGSTQRLDTLTRNISNTFGGQAKAQAETLSGSIQQMQNSMGDAAELMGQVLEPAMLVVVDLLSSAAEAAISFMRGLTETPLETTIRELEALNIEAESLMQLKNIQLNKEIRILNTELEKVNTEMLTQEDVQNRLNEIVNERADVLTELGKKQAKMSEDALSDVKMQVADVQARHMRERELMEDSNATRADFAASERRERETIAAIYENFYKNQGSAESTRLLQLDQEEEKLLEIASILAQRLGLEAQITGLNDRGTGSGGTDNRTSQEIELNSKLRESFVELRAERGEISRVKEEELLMDSQILAMQQLVQQGHKNQIDLTILENEMELKSIQIKKKKQKVQEDVTKQIIKDTIKLGQLLAKDEKDQKRLAFAGAMVDVISASVATFRKVSEVMLPPAPQIAALAQLGIGSAIAFKMNEFEKGGLVGGRRHSQGGTIIEAERGEYVMSRNAVDSIGVDNLDAMNQGGAGTSIVINNPIISSEFVETELPELIAEAVRKGVDFGMS